MCIFGIWTLSVFQNVSKLAFLNLLTFYNPDLLVRNTEHCSENGGLEIFVKILNLLQNTAFLDSLIV